MFELELNQKNLSHFSSGMDMRVNIPVRSRGWGFRGRRLTHAVNPPPTSPNFPLGKDKRVRGHTKGCILYVTLILLRKILYFLMFTFII